MSKHPFLSVLASVLFAAAPAAGATRSENPEETVQLSVFEVTADKDVGYQGGNTTSGSRLNTSLRDTAAAIMVLTPEFISDFGMNTLTEMIAYASNVQTDIGENTSGAEPGNFRGVDHVDPAPRIRGLKASVAMDFFDKYLIPVDNYNIERIEFASGPNSILFGLGYPGGLVNVTTKRARLERNRTAVRVQFGDFDFKRGELDHNQVVLPRKLALRLNGVMERAGSWRQWESREINRGAASLRFSPWAKTNLVANFEKGRSVLPLSLPFNALDARSLWQASGAPRQNDAAWVAADRAVGINRSTAVRTIYVTDAAGGSPFVLSTRNAAGFRLLESTNEDFNILAAQRAGNTQVPASVFPYDVSSYGPASTRTTDFQRLYLNVEQAITRDFMIDLAYIKLQASALVLAPINNLTSFFGDPNLVIPDPSGAGAPVANPYAGRLYLDTRWGTSTGGFPAEEFRVSGSYQLDLGKFGRHHFAAMGQRETRRNWRMNTVEILVDENNVPLANASVPENAANLLTRRNYVVPGDFKTYVVGHALEPVTVVRNGRTYRNKLINQNLNPGDVDYETDSLQGVTQSRFFDSKLVVTAGLRTDRIVIEEHGGGRLPADHPDVVAGRTVANTVAYSSDIEVTSKHQPFTYTAGAVYHATPRLSVFYNRGTNNGEPKQNMNILPERRLPPPAEGATTDFGFMLSLLEGRVFLRATAFETALRKTTEGIPLTPIRDPTTAILDTLLANNRITAEEHQRHDLTAATPQATYDIVNTGFELSNWYNLGRNFTALLNFSYTKTDRSNIAPEFDGWFEAEKAWWLRSAGAGSLPNSTAGSTVDGLIDSIAAAVEEIRNFNNFGYGNNAYKANLSARYTFTEGKLKGVFLGGGARWISKAKIGRVITGTDARGLTVYGSTIDGPEDFKLDGFLGYRREMTIGQRKPRMTVQLNVTNLTDENDVMPLRLNARYNGYLRVLLPEPRRIRLTAGLEL